MVERGFVARNEMRKIWITAAVGVAALVALSAWAADAQPRTKRVVLADRPPPGVVVRPRVIVTKRSYLDAGTEVKTGERKYLDYALPPDYSASDVFDSGRILYGRSTLPNRFWLPGSGLDF